MSAGWTGDAALAPPPITVRRIGAAEAQERVDALAASLADSLANELADVLMDCVEGGASVSFMLPLARDKALSFWRGVLASAARQERVLLVAENAAGRILGTVQLITAQPDNSRTAPMSPRCWCTATPAAKASPRA